MWKLILLGLLVASSWADTANGGLGNTTTASLARLDDNPPIALHSPSEGIITLSNLNGVSQLQIVLAHRHWQPPSTSVPETTEDLLALLQDRWQFEQLNRWTWISGDGQTFSEPFVVGPFEALSAVPASIYLTYRKLTVTPYYQVGAVTTTAEPTSGALLSAGIVAISLVRRRRARVGP